MDGKEDSPRQENCQESVRGERGGLVGCVSLSPLPRGRVSFLGGYIHTGAGNSQRKIPQTTPEDLLCALPWACSWSGRSLCVLSHFSGCSWNFPGKSTGVGCHCLLCCLSVLFISLCILSSRFISVVSNGSYFLVFLRLNNMYIYVYYGYIYYY